MRLLWLTHSYHDTFAVRALIFSTKLQLASCGPISTFVTSLVHALAVQPLFMVPETVVRHQSTLKKKRDYSTAVEKCRHTGGGDKKLLWQSPAIQLRPCTTARTQCAHYLTCNDQHAPPCCRGFDAGCHFECLTDVGAEQNCNLASVITGLSICSYRPVLGSFVTNIIAVFNLKWQEAAERDKEHHNAF